MQYGVDRWGDWPYGAYEPEQAREIRDLLDIAGAHKAANDPEVYIYEEPRPLEEGLAGRLENAVAALNEEVDGLEARLDRARPALHALEKLLDVYYEREDEE